MAYIPKNAEWYIAEIVEEIIVEGDTRNVVHRNLNLVRANSPEDAYTKALDLGREGESEYSNPAGKKIVIKFRGLGALSVVQDRLEHGAELRYIEDVDVPEAKIAELIKSKEQLSVFRDIEPSAGPNYACKEIVDEAYELMNGADHKGRK
jgi:hypothetical protein